MSKTEIGSEEVKQKYATILKDNGINKEIAEVIFVEPELRGEHMASACEYVTIKFSDGSENLDLFIKKYTTNELHTQFVKQMAIFEKESTFFNELLPLAKKFCMERVGNTKLVDFFPKSYYGDDSLIVLENLVKRNYFMLDKMERQDFDQAKIVLENMAKFHGVFHVIINEMGAENFSAKYPYAVKEAILSPTNAAMMAPMFDNNLVNCTRILEANEIEGSKEALEWLLQKVGKIYDEACQAVIREEGEKLFVLNHGDCWNNNMMFLRDKNTDEIIDHLFVDLQITRYGSPNIDIGYFLFTSVKPEVRRQLLTPLLTTYFDTLTKTVESLGSSLNVSFEEFVQNYKKKCSVGFYTSLTFLTAIAAMKEVDFDKSGTTMEEMTEYFNAVVRKWVDDNPDLGLDISKELVACVNEYRALRS